MKKIKKLIAHIIFDIFLRRWRIDGNLPNISKYVLIVAPHKHWTEVPLGWAVGKLQSPPPYKFLMKIEFTKFPLTILGWILTRMGGVTVDRRKEYLRPEDRPDRVKEMIDFLLHTDAGMVAIAPEGTRKVKEGEKRKWYAGFYAIAIRSNVPIVMGLFDHQNRVMQISTPYYLTGYVSQDIEYISGWFRKGKPGYEPLLNAEDFLIALRKSA